MKWIIECEVDCEHYHWFVQNKRKASNFRQFQCFSQSDAQWLCDILNKQEDKNVRSE